MGKRTCISSMIVLLVGCQTAAPEDDRRIVLEVVWDSTLPIASLDVTALRIGDDLAVAHETPVVPLSVDPPGLRRLSVPIDFVPALMGTRLLLRVDGLADDGAVLGSAGLEAQVPSGTVEASITLLTPAICGDGRLHPTLESCDDGNTVGGDGCSSHCRFEVTPEAGVASLVPTRASFGPSFALDAPELTVTLRNGSSREAVVRSTPSITDPFTVVLPAPLDSASAAGAPAGSGGAHPDPLCSRGLRVAPPGIDPVSALRGRMPDHLDRRRGERRGAARLLAAGARGDGSTGRMHHCERPLRQRDGSSAHHQHALPGGRVAAGLHGGLEPPGPAASARPGRRHLLRGQQRCGRARHAHDRDAARWWRSRHRDRAARPDRRAQRVRAVRAGVGEPRRRCDRNDGRAQLHPLQHGRCLVLCLALPLAAGSRLSSAASFGLDRAAPRRVPGA